MIGKRIAFIDNGCEVSGLSTDIEVVKAKTSDFKSELKAALDMARRSGCLVGYVIVTRDPSQFTDIAISNNIIRYENPEAAGKAAAWALSGFGRSDPKSGVFFCSDLHFNHRNIIKYCNRPWNSGFGEDGELIVTDDDLSRMNEDLIKNFNSVVGADSTTWFLGDCCMGPNQKEKIPELRARLNGKVNIVLGNHDHHSVKFYYDAGFDLVYDSPVVVNDFVVLSQAPMEFVKAPFFNVYGHIHDCSSYKAWSADSCCVCVERHEYRPVSMETIMEKTAELRDLN